MAKSIHLVYMKCINKSKASSLSLAKFTIKYIQQGMSVSYNTAKRYTEVLVKSGRIYPDDKKKNKVYRFYDLMDLMR